MVVILSVRAKNKLQRQRNKKEVCYWCGQIANEEHDMRSLYELYDSDKPQIKRCKWCPRMKHVLYWDKLIQGYRKKGLIP